MNYYEDKIAMGELIENLIKSKSKRSWIIYQVSSIMGFGSGTINRHINILIDAGVIEEMKTGELRWKKKK